MTPTKLHLYHFDQPFRFRFHSPQALRVKADSLLLGVEFEEGLVGWGECVPRDYVTGESIASVRGLLRDNAITEIFGADLEALSDIKSLLDRVEKNFQENAVGPYQCALAALDLAFVDAVGLMSQKPLEGLMGTNGPKHSSLLSASIPFYPEEMIRKYFPLLKEKVPFQAVKVLLGNNFEENMMRIRLIRELVGNNMDLRVEANGKWSFKEACRHLDRLMDFHPSAMEQPLRAEDIQGMKRLQKHYDIPIIADESLCSLEDARALIREDACRIFNIKVSKCGGLIRSMEIMKLAQTHGIRCQVGTHVGETDILGNAGRFIVETVPDSETWFDAGSAFLYEAMPEPFDKHTRPGAKRRSSEWGLGLESDYLDWVIGSSTHVETLSA